MNENDKERTIGGFAPWVIAGLIVGALWSIGGELGRINKALVTANCLTEAAHGITCPEAKK